MTSGQLPWTPDQPGWFVDPWDARGTRYFDGRAWTDQTQRHVSRGPFGPLFLLVGIAAAAYFGITHPSVSVPLAGVQDCGSSSFELVTQDTSQLTNTGSATTDQLGQQCIDKARTNLYYGGGAFVVGLIGRGIVRRYEDGQ